MKHNSSYFENLEKLNKYLICTKWEKELLKTGCEILGFPVILSDYSHQVIDECHFGNISSKKWQTLLEVKTFPVEWINSSFHSDVTRLITHREIVRNVNEDTITYIAPIIRGNSFYGYVTILEQNSVVSNEDLAILKRISDIYAIRYSENASVSLNNIYYGPIIRDLLEGKLTVPEHLFSVMKTRNWHRKNFYRVVNVRFLSANKKLPNIFVLKRISDISKQIIPFEYHGDILILIESNTKEYLSVLCNDLYKILLPFGSTIGVSEIFTNLLDIRIYSVQARYTARQEKAEKRIQVLEYVDFKCKHMIETSRKSLPAAQYYHAGVIALQKYDGENKTSLVKTLHEYLKNGNSITSCSIVMGVHKNTISSHLVKIKSIINSELSDSTEVFHIWWTLEMIQFDK